MARFVGRQDDDIRFALGVIDDHRRLIAAGKTHRWDMVKWAVTVNMALAGASVTLRAADDISQAKREGCRAHCRGRDALSRRQGYRSQETVLISLCNESTRSINVARSGAPKYLAERLIGTVRRECLDRLLIFG
jgi:hypothetical protein